VAILGHDAWQRRHDGDAQVLGKTILVSGIPARVVGIMPRRSGFPMTTDVWLPLSHLPERAEQSRDNRTLRVVGRVRDGIAASDAAREVDAIIDRVEASTAIPGAKVRARVVPINERFLGRVTNPAWLAFLAASLIVVLVSAANVANLMIARSALRRGEIAIRTSLGASRLRIVRQVLTESLVLAGAAAVVGLAVSRLGVYAFRSAIPENTLPYWIDYAVDARVLTALILVAALTVIVFGLLPAFQASKVDVNRVLISGGQSIIRARTRLSTAVFLVAEIALTVVLLANAVQAVRSRAPEVQSDKVLGTRDVLTASLTLPAARYGTPEQLTDFQLRAAERLREIPGVAHVSFASVLPSRIAPAHRLDVENVDRSADAPAPTVPVVAIAPDYFASLGLSMRRGREFLLADGESGREYAIVNERFVDVHFQGGEPLGRRISLTGGSSPGSQWRWFTIIGVAPDVRQSPARRAEPVAYIPIRASASASLTLVVRSSIDPEALTPRLREELHALDPNLPLYRAMTLGRSIAEAQWNSRVSARLIVSITLIAVVLSLVGLYAVTSHAVSQRMRELSVRLALGARPAQIRWLIIRHALLHASVGLAVGSLGTIAWNAAFVSERVDLTIASPANLAVVAASLAGIVLLACLAPARRAARLDPALVLRRP
jgi:putative ABC transport system permease protein